MRRTSLVSTRSKYTYFRTYDDLSGISVLQWLYGSKVIDCIKHRRELVFSVDALTSPHSAEWECIELEVGNDAEVAVTAS